MGSSVAINTLASRRGEGFAPWISIAVSFGNASANDGQQIFDSLVSGTAGLQCKKPVPPTFYGEARGWIGSVHLAVTTDEQLDIAAAVLGQHEVADRDGTLETARSWLVRKPN